MTLGCLSIMFHSCLICNTQVKEHVSVCLFHVGIWVITYCTFNCLLKPTGILITKKVISQLPIYMQMILELKETTFNRLCISFSPARRRLHDRPFS